MEPIIRSVSLINGVRKVGKPDTRNREEGQKQTQMNVPVIESKTPFIPTEVILPPEETPQIDAEQDERRQHELHALRVRAEQEGYAEGLKKAEQEAQRAIVERLAQLDDLIQQLERARSTAYESAEDGIVSFIYEMCCRIAVDHVMTPDAIAYMVKKNAASFSESGELLMRLHPQDLDAIQTHTDLDMGAGNIRWQGDLSVKLGGLMVETSAGVLDARLETQFFRLRDVLLSARNGKQQ